MITKLSKEQEAKMPLYVEKWTKIGLSTEPTNKERATKNVSEYYKIVGLNPPQKVVFGSSPFVSATVVNLFTNQQFVEDLGKKQTKKPKGKLNLDEKIVASILNMVKEISEKDTNTCLNAILKNLKPSSNWTNSLVGGNLWAGWQAFYDYFDSELNIPGCEKIRPTLALSQDVGYIFPFEKVCILTCKPKTLKLKNGRMHSDEGPALEYEDGFKIFTLNGVTMPEEIMGRPKEQVSASEILELKNAEQRMQGMKYLGLGKFFKELNSKVLDTKGGYELLLVELQGEMCEHLKMVNPSTGEIHLEGVKPGIKTVDEALAYRNHLTYFVEPIILT
jgi:hypothetical protein